MATGLTEICAQTDNTFTDSRDVRVYQTVTIGKQVWMAENLKYLPGEGLLFLEFHCKEPDGNTGSKDGNTRQGTDPRKHKA